MGILRDSSEREGAAPSHDGAALAFASTVPPPPAAESTAAPAGAGSDATRGEGAGTADPHAQRSELRRRRDALAEQVAELHWDLGGLAYEMAIRDHFRLDVLVRRAATLQERDAELAELERLLRMEEGGIAGSCPLCAAPHSRGALYCWQCGAQLMERRPSESAEAAAADADTVAIEALLAPAEPERGGGEAA